MEPSVDVASGSQLDSFLQCRRKYYYGYDLNLEPPSKGRAITLGTAGHALLGAYYRALMSGAGHREAVDSAQGLASWTLEVELGIDSTTAGQALQLCTLYWAAYADDLRWLRVRAVEQEFQSVLDGVPYAATVDLVVDDIRSGETQVWDHRFLGSFYDEHLLVIDPQLPRYVLLLRAAGIPVTGAVRNMVRTANRKTHTPEMLLRRIPVPITEERLATAEQERDSVLREWKAWRANPLWLRKQLARRTFSRSCDYCYYRKPCAMDADGQDSSVELETAFVPRTYGYTVTP